MWNWFACFLLQLGSRLLELMMDNSFVRPPANQDGDDNAELRPAFQHKFKNFVLSKGYGQILCCGSSEEDSVGVLAWRGYIYHIDYNNYLLLIILS